MSRICTICARGGSKGVPGKNTRMIAGKPLLLHTLDLARKSCLFDVVAVDSDDHALLELAHASGADLVLDRPAELATDTAGKLTVIARAVRAAEAETGQTFETLVDLDVTSPLRAVEDVTATIALVEDEGALNAITVSPANRSPYFNLVELTSSGTVELSKPADLVRRQDSPECFDMNASVYVWQRLPFLDEPFLFGPTTRAHVMPRARSFDIDEEVDFDIVEMLLEASS